MFEYLDWRGDLTFSASPLCPADMLIFAALSYCPMERLNDGGKGGTLRSLEATVYPADPVDGNDLDRLRCQLWRASAGSARFSGVTLERFLSHFDAAKEKQFAAALIRLDEHTGIVAYRGTDATLVGWKEDFNLSFESPIPAQTDAVAFLNEAAAGFDRLYLCGHSKGGNLAVYAAAHCESDARKKLVEIYSFDGPGLDDATADSAAYAEVSPRIRSYVPESSVIGMLMDYHNQYTIIDSDGVSIWQHNPFLWHIKGTSFVTRPELTRSGRYTDRTLHDFLKNCTHEERRVLVDSIFDIINATGAHSLKEIPMGVIRNFGDVRAALKQLSPENRAILTKVFKTLAEASGSNIDVLLGMGRENEGKANEE